ncbi:cutinase [Mycolicibacterium phlei]|uniref:Cutinase n=1 Tax=Mycolicibacterium phlei DSM 43239 = CCUG 21000 TaxID=1226750 RepID=A0A5N5UQI1_MYCPH|nr:Cutinase [Mycolicibacterium phlei]EID16906.1 cutinase [Mycolicibacterium phlei RIVM601174]KAB7751856.1 cutinase [Mycolicibacterium phlei DSM 43239 = CCUG 21000]KXW71040.1 cutinase [Mycolicibacterium phlei DSM 43070]VEG08326.1 cutinase [Mycobacteroides chelonae]
MQPDLVGRLRRRGSTVAGAIVIAIAGLLAPSVLPGTPTAVVPTAAAACPDAELIFARGRTEPPGPGAIGNALIGAIRSKTKKNVALYSVAYPADYQVDIGANDMSARIQDMAARCPDTRLVLGGYSLGAAVTDVVLAAPIAAFGFKNPLPPGMDRHIAAVALFGNGIAWVGPITNFNPLYNERTIELCHGADPICNPADPETWQANWPDHLARAYINAGMVNQAADFIVARI